MDTLLECDVSRFVANFQLTRLAQVRSEQLRKSIPSYAMEVDDRPSVPQPVLEFLRSERRGYDYGHGRFSSIGDARNLASNLHRRYFRHAVSITFEAAG